MEVSADYRKLKIVWGQLKTFLIEKYDVELIDHEDDFEKYNYLYYLLQPIDTGGFLTEFLRKHNIQDKEEEMKAFFIKLAEIYKDLR